MQTNDPSRERLAVCNLADEALEHSFPASDPPALVLAPPAPALVVASDAPRRRCLPVREHAVSDPWARACRPRP